MALIHTPPQCGCQQIRKTAPASALGFAPAQQQPQAFTLHWWLLGAAAGALLLYTLRRRPKTRRRRR